MEKTYIIAISLIILILGGIIAYYITQQNTEQTSTTQQTQPKESETLTMPLAPGSTLQLNVTTLTYVGPAENETQNTTTFNTTIKLEIISYNWPFINATVEYQNNATNQTLPIFVFEAPKEYIGKDSFNAPISLPAVNEGLCITFNLTNTTDETLVYTGKAKLFNYLVSITSEYYKNGIIKQIIFNIKSITPIQGNIVNITSIIDIISYNASGSYNVSLPGDWICEPPVSSHLWFTWEGIYKISGCKIVPTTLSDLRNGMNNKSIVMFLNKGCPHCINTWPNILEALQATCNESKIPVYIVIFGGFMNQTVDTYLRNTMLQGGITGYPAIAYYEKGFVRDKLMGERSTEEIRVFLEKYLANGGQG